MPNSNIIKKLLLAMSCVPIDQLTISDLISQLTDAQIQAIIDGRLQQRVVQYTGLGVTVYNKPSDLVFAFVVCIGAGGGGGSGRRGATSSNRCGGAGGASGSIARRWLTDSQIGLTENITVGAGGTGGAGIAVDNTNGSAGTSGGASSFGTLVVTNAANGGAGGGASTSSSGGSVGFLSALTPAQWPLSSIGTPGSNGGTAAPPATSVVGFQQQVGNNGAGGGGVSSANAQISGGIGSRSYDETQTNNVQGTSGNSVNPGGAGVSNWSLQLHVDYVSGVPLNTIGYGTSGGGGGGNQTAAGTAAGAAGLYGAGGSGGGGCINGFNSGAGSDGAQGCVLVFEYYV